MANASGDAFWQKVNKNAGTFCWLWMGCTDRAGYGVLSGRRAHRISWELHHGSIPPGKIVRHRCDNPSCVNPDHLLLGTHYDNAVDRHVSRGNPFNQRASERGHSRYWWPGYFEAGQDGVLRPGHLDSKAMWLTEEEYEKSSDNE